MGDDAAGSAGLTTLDVLRRAAERWPAEEALVDGDVRLTFSA